MTASAATVDALQEEMARSRAKFPGNRHMLAALLEEAGEVARALLQDQGANRVREEALQVAATALRIYEEGDAAFDVKDWDATT
jgi:NTP pyrophosphatase (non-canonical NTP hydrolase)